MFDLLIHFPLDLEIITLNISNFLNKFLYFVKYIKINSHILNVEILRYLFFFFLQKQLIRSSFLGYWMPGDYIF